jgi:hypothetical protein
LEGKTAGENCRQIKYFSNLEVDSTTVTHEPGLSTAYENCGAIFKRVSLVFRDTPQILIGFWGAPEQKVASPIQFAG